MLEHVTYTRCIYSFGSRRLKLIALSNNHIEGSAALEVVV